MFRFALFCACPRIHSNVYPTTPVAAAGEEAFLRTKKLLDDAANATEALFDEDGDVSRRYQRIQAREAALGLGMGNNMSENKQSFPPHPLFTTSVFHGFLPASTADDADGANIDGTGLAAASRVANQDPIERRPEERLFCEAFLELRELLVSMPQSRLLRCVLYSHADRSFFGLE